MKREIRTGPKRLRWTRRDWSGCHGNGQARRWDSSEGKFKTEREARRAGLTGKRGKHRGQGADPMDWNPAHAFVYALLLLSAPSGARRVYATTDVREAQPDSLANKVELDEEEEAGEVR